MARVAFILAVIAVALIPCHTPAAQSPMGQRHVLTADYLGSPYGSTTVTPSQAAPFLSWAQVTVRMANAVSQAGIKTQYYVDPVLSVANRGDQMYTSDETTFAHDCVGNRVSVPYDSLSEYLMAVEQPSMQNVFGRWVSRVTSVAHFDALFEDDADLPSEYFRFRAMPCKYEDNAWLKALDELNHHSSIPVIVSGLNASRRPEPSGAVQLLSSDKTLGENFEHCYANDAAHPKTTGDVWKATENSELRVTAAGKLFECMARDQTSAASAVDARIYLYASFLLSYDPSTSVMWEEYGTPSRFRVEPETELVALSPIKRAPSAVSGLGEPGGTYVRQFARCYVAGSFVGACAAFVNPDDSPHALPLHEYRHTLVLSGGGVLDGGTVSTKGPPPPATLGPAEAVIVFR